MLGKSIRRFGIALLGAALLFGSVAPGIGLGASEFRDTDNHWAAEAIASGVSKGWVQGYDDNSFRPDQSVSRAEFVALVNRIFQLKAPGGRVPFHDVAPEDWHYPEVAAARQTGLVSGYPDGGFRPGSGISRQEAAVIVDSLLAGDGSGTMEATAAEAVFADSPDFPAWSADAIARSRRAGAINGYLDGTYRSEAPISRAEALTLLSRVQKLGKPYQGIKGVADGSAAPAVGAAEVRMFAAGGKKPLSAVNADEAGRYALSGWPGTYDLTAQRGDELGFASDVRIERDRTTLVPLTMSAGVHLTGRVVDASGDVLPRATLYFTTNPTFTAITDAEGRFDALLPSNRTYTMLVEDGDETYREAVTGIRLGREGRELGTIRLPAKGEKATAAPPLEDLAARAGEEGASVKLDALAEDAIKQSKLTLRGTSTMRTLTYKQASHYFGSIGHVTALPAADGGYEWTLAGLVLAAGDNQITIRGEGGASDTLIVHNPASDRDGDGITDEIETTLGTNPDARDTDDDGLNDTEEYFWLHTDPLLLDTDGDGLYDGFELMYELNPLASDTDGSGLPDGQKDLDQDGLSNLEEQTLQTNPRRKDTDGDGLTDGDEVRIYYTDPLIPDTDEDGLDDGSELKFGTDPLKGDSDGNGLSDGDERRLQTVAAPSLHFRLTFEASGDADKTTKVQSADVRKQVGAQGMFGQVSITSTSRFDEAELAFEYDAARLNGTKESDLAIFYYNPLTMTLEPVSGNRVDASKHTVYGRTTHFSTYVLADYSVWASTWPTGKVIRGSEFTKRQPEGIDVVFVIDSSGSMGSGNGPEYNHDLEKERIKGTKLAVDALRAGDRAAIIDFDDKAVMLQTLTDDKTKLKAAADQIDAEGATNIGLGISGAMNELLVRGRERASKAIVLLTDGKGDYQPELTTKAKQSGVKIYTIGLGDDTDEALLRGMAAETGGHFYHAADASELVDIFRQTSDKMIDSDQDGLPDWVEKAGYVVKATLGITYEGSDPFKADSDGDGLSDQDEIGDWYYEPDADRIFITRESMVDGQANRPMRSNPEQADTDGDGKSDLIDQRPLTSFMAPFILIHGIFSDTGSSWGADNEMLNYIPAKSRFFPGRDEAAFKRNAAGNDTFKHKEKGDSIVYKAMSVLEHGRGMEAADTLPYGDIDAQYIRSVNDKNDDGLDQFVPWLEAWQELLGGTQYKRNESFFVYNWEAADRIAYASQGLKDFLKELADYIEQRPELGLDILQYDEKTAQQIPQFDVVGHSAGGLVTRLYIETMRAGNDPNVRKLITIDTPHTGANSSAVGSMQIPNIGPCGTVLTDLDRDDSTILYESKLTLCTKVSGTLTGIHPTTEYNAVAGIRLNHLFTEHEKPLLVEGRSELKTDEEVLKEVIAILAKNRKTLSHTTNVEAEQWFGDTSVTVGSSLGIPSDDQQGVALVPMDKKFYYIGHGSFSDHTKVEHQSPIFTLIYYLLSGKDLTPLVEAGG